MTTKKLTIGQAVIEQIINIVMNVKAKTNDDLKARKDMPIHCKHRRLGVQVVDVDEGNVC